jgi:hypothetical protein
MHSANVETGKWRHVRLVIMESLIVVGIVGSVR